MNNKRELNPAQRAKKNLRDRQFRLKKMTEFKRLQKSEADSTAELEWLKNEIRESRENEERLKFEVSNLLDFIHQQRQEILKLKETLNEVDSLFDWDNFPSRNEDVAQNDPITQCPGSSQSAIQFADSLFDRDNFTSRNEDVAQNDPITQCPGSSQSAIQFADDVIAKYWITFKAAD